MKEQNDKSLAIGVDVGGSHVSCAAVDLHHNDLLEHTHSENELDNHAQPEIIIEAIGKTIKKCLEKADPDQVSGIGFAMPGPFDYVKGISRFRGENGKFEHTYGLNVSQELRKYLALPDNFKIRYINDATAFAIGEDRFGKAKAFPSSLSITLGTGFGSAFITDNMPVLEGDNVPEMGCVWHLPFEGDIADAYFSTRGFLHRYKLKTGKQLSGVKALATLAEEDDIARELFDDFGYKLGAFLGPWLSRSESEVLVIGGNIANAYDLFGHALKQGLDTVDVAVETSELKESASMIGSAYLLDDTFYNRLLPLLALM